MAKIPDIEKELANGLTLRLRNPRPKDAEALMRLTLAGTAEEDFIIREASEVAMTLDEEREFIEKLIEHPTDLALVAEVDGIFAGFIDFHGTRLKNLAHTGEFGMSILEEYRNQGVGRAMLQTLLAWAESHPTLEKVGLTVLNTNPRAIALYKKMGFVEEGVVRKMVKRKERYIDGILMAKFLKNNS